MTSVVPPRQSTRFICRSYTAVVLAPQPPIIEWVADIDQRIKDAGSFFVGPPVVLDLSAVTLSKSAIEHLMTELEQRGVRVMGIENVIQPRRAQVCRHYCVPAGERAQMLMQPDRRCAKHAVGPPHSCSTSRYARGNRSSFPMAT